MFTAHAEQDLLWEALDAGAQGFVLKDSESAAPGRARSARRWPASPTWTRAWRPTSCASWPGRGPGGILERAASARSCQMLANGHSNREVSERLVVSVETIKTHVKHILAKLEAEHRTQAVAIGIRQALIR